MKLKPNRFNSRIFSFNKKNNSHNIALASAGIKINNNTNTNTNTNIDYSSYITEY
jgi:hypothetical protein